ncbi:MAG: DMT family transporter [Desulfurococcales archaeon]|nr:DMT family transporter [Desulfurococcales archaeon]
MGAPEPRWGRRGLAGARWRYAVLLAIAVTNISTASIFVRLAGVQGFVAASWRLAISAAITLAMLAASGSIPRISDARDLALMAASGAALALHFGFWMMSLYHLTVAASVTIVDSYPALLAIVGSAVLGEEYRAQQLAGAAAAMAGVAWLAVASTSEGLSPPGGDPRLGVALSLAGMVCVAVYFSIGKVLRERYDTLSYTGVVYSVAALVSTAVTLGLGYHLLGYEGRVYLYLLGLALLPMLGGHTIINYALKHVSLLAATVPVLGEPVGATLLAWLVLGEEPRPPEIAPMALVIFGIGLVLYYEEAQG